MCRQSGSTNIVKLPLAFVRSGYVYLNFGFVFNVGDYGYNWSRTAKSSTIAYHLNMDPSDVDSESNEDDRWVGLPLRCRYLDEIFFLTNSIVSSKI